jgi:hypothetical protein
MPPVKTPFLSSLHNLIPAYPALKWRLPSVVIQVAFVLPAKFSFIMSRMSFFFHQQFQFKRRMKIGGCADS